MSKHVMKSTGAPSSVAAMLEFFVLILLTIASSALAALRYVDLNSTNATPPYTNWATAATNIQDAVDAAASSDEIVVTNGIYASGGRTNGINAPGLMDGARVIVDKPLTLRSANGPGSTVIDGGLSLRCVHLTDQATLSGFTLINGTTLFEAGAGVWCASSNAVVSDCRISSNTAVTFYGDNSGGGVYGGTLNNCTLIGNQVRGFQTDFNLNPTLTASGGGAAYSTLNRCILSHNTVSMNFLPDRAVLGKGGGAAWCTLNNCTLNGNAVAVSVDSSSSVRALGGGAFQCMLNNCTLTGNSASGEGGCSLPGCRVIFGGGTCICGLNNCILYFNTVAGGTGAWSDDYGSTLDNCSFADPMFVDYVGGNLRLQSNSPCINAGSNAYAPAGTDVDGNPRIVGGTVDIGAYEYQSLSLINFGVVSNRAGFIITGQSNQVVIVEISSDLANWSPLVTNTLGGHPLPFSDPMPASLPGRFYRAQAQ